MKLIMIAVISSDGFLTHGSDPNPSSWSSPEDIAHYRQTLRNFPVLIMGRTTYEMAKSTLPSEPLKVVLSSQALDPDGQNIRFVSGTPDTVIDSLETGYDRALLLGGAEVFKEFLAANTVDEILLTVEPVELNDGLRLFENWQLELSDLDYSQQDSRPLNQSGTILYTYKRKL